MQGMRGGWRNCFRNYRGAPFKRPNCRQLFIAATCILFLYAVFVPSFLVMLVLFLMVMGLIITC